MRDKLNKVNERYKALEAKLVPQIQRNKKEKAQLRAIQAQIDKVKKQISKEVQIEAKKQIATEKTALIKQAQSELDVLREILKETDHYKEAAMNMQLKNAKAATQRSIENYERRIKEGDFLPKSTVKAMDEELRKMRIKQRRVMHKFQVEKHRWERNNRTRGEKIADGLAESFALPRAMMASLDLSAPLRQGFILSAANPRMAGKALVEMLKQAASKKRYEDWLERLEETDEYQYAKSVGLYISMPNAILTAKEEEFISSLAEKIPVYGTKFVQGSSRAYSAYLNIMRMGVWERMNGLMEKNGLDQEKDKDVYRGMARFINNTTGRGGFNYSNKESGAQESNRAMNALFFAPKYVHSRLNLLNPWFYYKLPKPIRKEVARTMMSFMSAGFLMMALAKAAGAEVEDDPRSTDFGKIRFGDIRMDVWAGFQQPIRLMATMITRSKKSTRTGEVKDLNMAGYKQNTIADELFRFGRTKLSPTSGAIVDFLYAPREEKKMISKFGMTWEEKVLFQNVIGEDLTASEKLINMLAPLYISDMGEILREEGAGTAAAVFFPALLGVGVQRYESGSPNKTKDESEEISNKEAFELNNEILNAYKDYKP